MEVLKISGAQINSSIDEFYEGSVPPHLIESAAAKVDQFENTRNPALIPEFMRVVDEGDALFPVGFGFHFGKRPLGIRKFYRNYSFFEEDLDNVLLFLGNRGLKGSSLTSVKRLLLAIHLSTTVRRLSDLSEEIWTSYISVMKNEDSQWKEELDFNAMHRRAFSALAEYMNAHFPTVEGYDKPVKVKRRSNVGP